MLAPGSMPSSGRARSRSRRVFLIFFPPAVRKTASGIRIDMQSGDRAAGEITMSGSASQAKSIFLEALEKHTPEQWPAFLEQACAGDAPLREQVEKLLRARSELGSFHEAPR